MEEADLGSRTEYDFPVTQAQLGDAMGLTPVHVNRTLQGLKREGILRTDHKAIQIGDWDRLAEIAEFDPDFLLIERMDERDAV